MNETTIWTELEIEASAQAAEAVSAFLVDLLGRGVVEEEIDTFDLEPRIRIKAYLSREDLESGALDEIERHAAGLREFFSDPEAVIVKDAKAVREDWHEGWKRYFKPLRIGDRLVVKPTWEAFAPDKADVVIEIDPGQAFGVGTHATTWLILEEMEHLFSSHLVNAGPRVLDVGCGTGILGIAAAKLGASEVICTDIDPAAVEAARRNAKVNRCHHLVSVTSDPLWKIEGTFHLILANIDRDTLKLLSKDLAVRLDPANGLLLASGILAEQVDQVLEAFSKAGLVMVSKRLDPEGQWAVLTMEHEG